MKTTFDGTEAHAPVHLHDKVHDGKGEGEEGENGEGISATALKKKNYFQRNVVAVLNINIIRYYY